MAVPVIPSNPQAAHLRIGEFSIKPQMARGFPCLGDREDSWEWLGNVQEQTNVSAPNSKILSVVCYRNTQRKLCYTKDGGQSAQRSVSVFHKFRMRREEKHTAMCLGCINLT